jgi:putative heme-binding domain-containing protein
MLSELLIALEAPDRISTILGMLDSAPTQEEQLWHIFALRNVDRGWTLSQREKYFQWLKRSEDFSGAHYLHRFLTFIRSDALGTLSAEDRKELSPLIDRLGKSTGVVPPAASARPEIHKWTLDELTPALDSVGPGRDLARGKKLFADALCARCHRLRGEGLPIGPDLDGVAARFGRRDLVETIVSPSKVVDEKYRNVIIETDDGEIITGQLAGGDGQSLAIAVDPLEPAQLRRVSRQSIVTRRSSPVSIMPEGLLNTLDRDEILDLIAYLESSP